MTPAYANPNPADSTQAGKTGNKPPEFGRKHILASAAPGTLSLLQAVSDKLDRQRLQAEPRIRMQYPGMALKQFCLGSDARYPDIVATTRAMNHAEYQRCSKRNIGAVIQVKIGHEALVLATAGDAGKLQLNRQQLFLALANNVPDPQAAEGGRVIDTAYRQWRDIDKALPAADIRFFAPPEKSRVDRSVRILGMEGGCRQWPWIADLKYIQRSYRLYREICQVPRKDGRYSRMPSEQIPAKLQADKTAVGLLGYNHFDRHRDRLRALPVEGLPPTVDTISQGLYPLARPYYVYIKASALTNVQGVSHFMKELLNEKTLGKDGYLSRLGLVSLPAKVLKKEITRAVEFTAMEVPEKED